MTISTPAHNRWKTYPLRSRAIFLVAVFFVFASFGIASDVADMGMHTPIHFAVNVLLAGLFAMLYAGISIALGNQFWKGVIPLFVVHFLAMLEAARLFPVTEPPVQFSVAQTVVLQSRLGFDGLALIATIGLGYCGMVYVSISEGRRHGRAQVVKALLDGEMSAAREVQRVMVPEVVPAVAGYSIDSVYRPASEVGGDFFQVVPLPSGDTLVVIGDVSGKGLRAAMIVSMIVGTLRTAAGFTTEPAEVLGELNRRLVGRVHDGFATCLVLRLEPGGRLTLANAGHLPPYLDGVEIQVAGALPLGLDEGATYEQSSMTMEVGGVVTLLTDGIAEAQDAGQTLFGFSRIESLLRSGATAHSVAEKAQQFGQNDDITVLTIERRQ